MEESSVISAMVEVVFIAYVVVEAVMSFVMVNDNVVRHALEMVVSAVVIVVVMVW